MFLVSERSTFGTRLNGSHTFGKVSPLEDPIFEDIFFGWFKRTPKGQPLFLGSRFLVCSHGVHFPWFPLAKGPACGGS